MNHRFGRHGFEAWRRLRKRRNRFTRSVVPQTHITVIHVHLQFDKRERIFIVGLDESGRQVDQMRQVDIVNAYAVTPPPAPQIQRTDTFGQLKHHATMNAAARAEADALRLDDRRSEDELRSYARSQGLAYVRDHVTAEMAGGRTPMQLRDIYVEAFLEQYRAYLAEETGNGNLPDEETRRIKRRAREDRAQDDLLHKRLSPLQINYQAAIRSLELLLLDTNNETDYLVQIEKFAGIYSREYSRDKEVEREQRDPSNPFPGPQRS